MPGSGADYIGFVFAESHRGQFFWDSRQKLAGLFLVPFKATGPKGRSFVSPSLTELQEAGFGGT